MAGFGAGLVRPEMNSVIGASGDEVGASTTDFGARAPPARMVRVIEVKKNTAPRMLVPRANALAAPRPDMRPPPPPPPMPSAPPSDRCMSTMPTSATATIKCRARTTFIIRGWLPAPL
jgi:hypothetical protein